MSEQPTTTETPAPATLDLTQAVWQLRLLVCGLGAALLVLSLAFNLFVWKQNRNINAAAQARLQQLSMLDTRVKQLARVANDLGSYAAEKPELVAIFTKYGLQLKPAAPSTATQP
jgi:type II secretory pathway component PulM